MAFNKVSIQEVQDQNFKKATQVLYEVDALQTGLRETVKAIAEEMVLDLHPTKQPRLPQGKL